MFSTIARQFRSARNYRRTVAELRGMDDRMLSDIGIARGEIERIVLSGR